MEKQNTVSIPLIIPTALFVVVWILGMTVTIAAHNSSWGYVFGEISLWPQVVAEGFGTSGLFLPVLHVIIAAFFKTQRTRTARRKIIIGWGFVLLVLQGFMYF